jgi:hypothetical protein
LRLQAQNAGKLQTTQQHIVRTEPPPQGTAQTVIIIEPAQPNVVYVPVYNPNVVFGPWPYSAVPPVFFPPPPGYAFGSALLTGMAFATGVAVVGSLWGWARPSWGRGGNNINVNVNRWNTINVNRPWQGPANGNWRPNNPNFRPGGNWNRPGGPVGRPTRLPGGLPPNAIGRPGVSVPGGVVRPPSGMGPVANRPGIGGPGTGPVGNRPGGGRPGLGESAGNRPGGGRPGLYESAGNRPGGGRPGLGESAGNRPGGREPGLGQRPGGGQSGIGQRPGGRPGSGVGAQTRPAAPARQPSALGGLSDGRNAQSFGNRGAQSRQIGNRGTQARQSGGGAPRVGGGRAGGRRG